MSQKVSKSETGQNQVPPTREERDAAYSEGGGRKATEEPKAKSGKQQDQIEAPVGLDMETRADELDSDSAHAGKNPHPGDVPAGGDLPEDGEAALKGKPSREGEAVDAGDETRADEEWAEGMYEDPAQAQDDEGGEHPTSPAGSTSDTDELPDEDRSAAP